MIKRVKEMKSTDGCSSRSFFFFFFLMPQFISIESFIVRLRMATLLTETVCVVCNKERRTYLCDGCSQRFCREHLDEHQKNLEQGFDQLTTNHDELRQMINDRKQHSRKHPIIKEIDQWEINAIEKIKQTANQCRERVINLTGSSIVEIEGKLDQLAQQMTKMRQEKEFNDLDLYRLKQQLNQLQNELIQLSNLCIRQQATAFIHLISIERSTRRYCFLLVVAFGNNFYLDLRWKQHATTIAGGNGQGNRLDQLFSPFDFVIDYDTQTLYIADWGNARILEWTPSGRIGRVLAGGQGEGNHIHQLNHPADVIIDRQSNSLIIADQGNKRVLQWSPHKDPHAQVIIADIDCCRLAMHRDGTLYVSDCGKNEVKQWKRGETHGTVVAGGNGQGNALNQLCAPTSIFVDDDHTLYISDTYNHRVMKWMKGRKEGVVVAGGNGLGNRTTQLSCPHGTMIDRFGQIYVADCGNNRVMRWCEGEKEGVIVVGGNGSGGQANQLSGPRSLSFDGEGNLYLVDCGNHRIQKFDIDAVADPMET